MKWQTENSMVVGQGLGAEGNGESSLFNESRGASCRDEQVLNLNGGNGYSGDGELRNATDQYTLEKW